MDTVSFMSWLQLKQEIWRLQEEREERGDPNPADDPRNQFAMLGNPLYRRICCDYCRVRGQLLDGRWRADGWLLAVRALLGMQLQQKERRDGPDT